MYTEFHVTGIKRDGSRFKLVYTQALAAFNINLYRGSVWGVLPNGKRKLLKSIYN